MPRLRGQTFIINGGGKQYTVQPYSRPDAGVFLVTDGSTRYLLSNTTSAISSR
ncbi:MAG: hypothetical protein IPL35_01755 [Sphingobacteriales bacterium]|nr:hypothetical protein [Sphingobacteriales bacterium]